MIDPATNRLHAVQLGPTTTYAYAHDANGNTLSEATSRHFEWNDADQLKAFRTQTPGAEPSLHAQYLYDAAGHRVKKLVRRQGGRVEVTHYIDGTFEHHRWGSGSSTAANNDLHVMDGARRIALLRVGPARPGDSAPPIRYELADHVGSASVTLDAAGALVDREDFTPYGETSFGSYARKRYRFTGMERDEESSLAYHGARYLAPWLARWTSCDPAGPLGGVNLYAYAAGNPIALSDAAGTQPTPALTPNAEGVYELPEQFIEVQGTAPEPSYIERIGAAGLVNLTSPAELRRQAQFHLQHDKSDRSWMRPPPDEWSATVDPEGARADADAQLSRAVANTHKKNLITTARQWEHSTNRMSTAAGVGNIIGLTIGMGGMAVMGASVPAVGWGLRGLAVVGFLHHIKNYEETGDERELGHAAIAGLAAWIPETPTGSGPLLSGPGGPTRIINGVRVVDIRTGTVLEGTVDLQITLDRIASGVPFPHRNDGAIFQNLPLLGKTIPELPIQPRGYYREFVHPTPGITGPGPQRIVTGRGGEMYYTPDHYRTFIPLN